MRVFIAGATGTLGIPLVRALVARGHQVIGLSRSPEKQALLEHLGARAAIADALDAEALTRVMRQCQPSHVVHLLTALPKNGVPSSPKALAPTNTLRIHGTANLLQASSAAGVQRIVGESFLGIYGYNILATQLLSEDQLPAEPPPDSGMGATINALRSLEDQLLGASRQGQIEAIVLRFGLFYGAESPSTQSTLEMLSKRQLPLLRRTDQRVSFIHIDDATAATIAALERGRPGAAYNIVDDEPISFGQYARTAARMIGAPRPLTLPLWLMRLLSPIGATMMTAQMPLSNALARRELGWQPRFRNCYEGLEHTVGQLYGPALASASS